MYKAKNIIHRKKGLRFVLSFMQNNPKQLPSVRLWRRVLEKPNKGGTPKTRKRGRFFGQNCQKRQLDFVVFDSGFWGVKSCKRIGNFGKIRKTVNAEKRASV